MNPLIHCANEWTAAGLPILVSPGASWPWAAGLVLYLIAMAWPLGVFAAGDREGKVRAPILAGSWYEGTRAALDASLDSYLQGRDRPDVPVPGGATEARALADGGRTPAAVIVPHAGHVYSGECAGQAFRLLEGSRYRRVILLGPSHTTFFRGAALPEEGAFSTPLGVVPLDRDAVRKLQAVDGFQVLPAAHAQEHCLEIELPFLQKVLPAGFQLVPAVVGRLDEPTLRSIAQGIASLWDDSTLLVISSDFTHYGPNFDYVPFQDSVADRLYKLDQGAVERIVSGNLKGFESYRDSTGATICGAEPIRILLEAAARRPLLGKLVEYYRSGDKIGDFRNSVSYAAIVFFPGDRKEPAARTTGEETIPLLDREDQDHLLRLSRQTLEALVNDRPLPRRALSDLPSASLLREKRGVFVTLTEAPSGDLRGCIGSIIGEQPLIEGVVQNTIAAASRDPRFLPVDRNETRGLKIEISVLTPLRIVSGPDQIVIGRDGVVLEKGGRRAVFLPQVAPEQGWDVPEMLRHLSLKAGMGPNDWKSGTTFYTFQAQVFEEEQPAAAHGR